MLIKKLTWFLISALSITGYIIVSNFISGDLQKEVLICENNKCDLANWFTFFVGAMTAVFVAIYIWKKQGSLKQLQTESSLLYVIQNVLNIQTHIKSIPELISKITASEWNDIKISKFEIVETFNQNQINISKSIKKIFQEKDSFEQIIERSYYVVDPKIILQLENISERIENISFLSYVQLLENMHNFDSYIDQIMKDRLKKYYQKLPKRIKDKYS